MAGRLVQDGAVRDAPLVGHGNTWSRNSRINCPTANIDYLGEFVLFTQFSENNNCNISEYTKTRKNHLLIVPVIICKVLVGAKSSLQ